MASCPSLTALNVTDTALFMTTNSRMASAIHIMSFVAYAGDEGTTSEAIAKSLQTNPVVVRKILKLLEREGVPVANQIRTYWWCSPPRIGRQRMSPASSTAREIGASFSKDKSVRISL